MAQFYDVRWSLVIQDARRAVSRALDVIECGTAQQKAAREPALSRVSRSNALWARFSAIKHIGLSEVSVRQLHDARTIVSIASVQNRYLPIPRTSNVAHLVENVAAAGVGLTEDEINTLNQILLLDP